ncbi:hypothetical protein [Peribacillus frigoritolerans]|uniref:hypothetical protein n=1 Tax=Peribacillus frigoritolerans TaxID=450367 RepID=UPI0007BEF7AB|nr:hypothetical protein [Peribacillus frigoritolerans]
MAAVMVARGGTVFSSSFLVLAGYGFADKKKQPIYSAVFFIPITREFRTFTRELRFTREFLAFTREFLAFTHEFLAFTRELHFTREFRNFYS